MSQEQSVFLGQQACEQAHQTGAPCLKTDRKVCVPWTTGLREYFSSVGASRVGEWRMRRDSVEAAVALMLSFLEPCQMVMR